MNFTNILEKQSQLWIIILGLALMGYGIYFFLDIQSMEEAGTEVRMKKIFEIIYNMGGKYAILAIFEVVGLIALISGFKQLRN